MFLWAKEIRKIYDVSYNWFNSSSGDQRKDPSLHCEEEASHCFVLHFLKVFRVPMQCWISKQRIPRLFRDCIYLKEWKVRQKVAYQCLCQGVLLSSINMVPNCAVSLKCCPCEDWLDFIVSLCFWFFFLLWGGLIWLRLRHIWINFFFLLHWLICVQSVEG